MLCAKFDRNSLTTSKVIVRKLLAYFFCGNRCTISYSPLDQMLDFSFAALTVNILVGRQEGHPACMKLGVSGDDMTGALHVL